MRDVIVLGSGRSGTSMAAGMMASAGWWAGEELYPPREANPKGFFEAPEINRINEELLAPLLPADQHFAYGQRWLSVLSRGASATVGPELEVRIRRLVQRRPFVFKDPRFCYTLDAWRRFLPREAAVVCVFRYPGAVAESIVKECRTERYLWSLSMDRDRALAVWTAMYEAVLAYDGSHTFLFVHYDQLFSPDGVARLERFIDASVDRSFPESTFRRQYSERPLPPRTQELYRELCFRGGYSPETRVSRPPPKPGARTAKIPAVSAQFHPIAPL